MRVRGCAWEGGGVLGLAYARPLVEMDAELDGGLRSLEILAGTSAGAITAAIVALGAPADEVEDLALGAPWKELAGDSWGVVRDTWRVLRTGGWGRLEPARDWLGSLLVGLGHERGTTFGDLLRHRGRDLNVVAVNETRGRLEVLGPRTTPGVRILDGVLASMAIPLLWPPVRIGSSDYLDGGLLNNHPMDLLRDRGLWPRETVGFALDSSASVGDIRPRRGPFARVARIVRILLAEARRAHVAEEYWSRVVRIDCGAIGPTAFDLTSAQKRWLLEQGESAWRAWKAKQREEAA